MFKKKNKKKNSGGQNRAFSPKKVSRPLFPAFLGSLYG